MQRVLSAFDFLLGPPIKPIANSSTVVDNVNQMQSTRDVGHQLEEGELNSTKDVWPARSTPLSDDDEDYNNGAEWPSDDDNDVDISDQKPTSQENGIGSTPRRQLEENYKRPHRRQLDDSDIAEESAQSEEEDEQEEDDEEENDEEDDAENGANEKKILEKTKRWQQRLVASLRTKVQTILDKPDNHTSETRILVHAFNDTDEDWDNSTDESDFNTSENFVSHLPKVAFSFNLAHFIQCVIDQDYNTIIGRLASLLKKKQIGNNFATAFLVKKYNVPARLTHSKTQETPVTTIGEQPSPLAAVSPAELSAKLHEEILNGMPGLQSLYRVQQVYLDSIREFNDEHRDVLTENLNEYCLLRRDAQPTLDELADRFIMVECSPKIVKVKLACTIECDINELRSQDVITYRLDSGENAKRIFSQYQHVWPMMVKVSAREANCNFGNSFEISMPFVVTEMNSSRRMRLSSYYSVKCQPVPTPLPGKGESFQIGHDTIPSDGVNNTSVQQNTHHLQVFSGGVLRPSASFVHMSTDLNSRTDINRNRLWAIYVVGLTKEKLMEWMTPCEPDLLEGTDVVIWKRNIVTLIILQTLAESREFAPPVICQMANDAIRSGTSEEFVLSRAALEQILNYIQPHLRPCLPESLALEIIPLSRSWKHIEPAHKSSKVSMKISVSLYLRCFKDAPVSPIEQQHVNNIQSFPHKTFDVTPTFAGKSNAGLVDMQKNMATVVVAPSMSVVEHQPFIRHHTPSTISPVAKLAETLGLSEKPKKG